MADPPMAELATNAQPRIPGQAVPFTSETGKAAKAVAVANGLKRVSLTKAVKRYCRRHPHDLMAAAGELVKTAGDASHRHWPEAIKALAVMLDGLPGQAKGKATGGLRLTFSDLQAMATGATQVSAQVTVPLDVTPLATAIGGAGGQPGAAGGPGASSGPVNDDRVGARLVDVPLPGSGRVELESQPSPEPVAASPSPPVEVDPVEEGKT